MGKDKYGICLSFYAIVAFILAFLGQVLLCGLLLGFVIISTKDEWLTRQVIQAFFLSLFGAFVNNVFDIFKVITNIPLLGTLFSSMTGILTAIISLFILLFSIIAIVKVNKGEDASVPFFSGLANKAYGLVVKKIYEEK